MPADGPGAVARLGRRLIALMVDWLACLVISSAFFHANSWATLAVFAVIQVLTVGTLGTSPGHRLLRMRVVRAEGARRGQPPGPLAALVRTVLLCLVVPAVVYDLDHRGLHDRAAGTVLIRTR